MVPFKVQMNEMPLLGYSPRASIMYALYALVEQIENAIIILIEKIL